MLNAKVHCNKASNCGLPY